MNRRSALALIFAGAIGISVAGFAAAGQSENIDALYKVIIDTVNNAKAEGGEWKGQRTDYTGKDNPKALVVCINWREVSPTRYRGGAYYRTGSSKNPPSSTEAAVTEATNLCAARCKATCALVDSNNQNALQPPADWYR
jgi:hypothetical protein